MIDLYQILDEALTIPANKAGPVELKLRIALEQKYKDFKYADTIVKCCRNDEKSGKMSVKELSQTYVIGLGNLIDLFKSYDKCKAEYIKQKLDKKVDIERADGKTVELDPAKDLNKIGRLSVLKQFVDKFEKLVQNDTTISSSFKKYAITEEDRKCIRLMCWNSHVMVWGTKEFSPSQKFAVQLWQNIDTIDSGSAYGEPDEQCPYCTHSINHWEQHAEDDPNYEQYWYLAIPTGVKCVKVGDLNTPEVVKVYNQLKGLGPKILICQHDSGDDWCDRDDNPISEYGIDIHDAGDTVYLVDGEPVYDEDRYDEAVDFNFTADGKDYFDDVVSLYDKNFTLVSRLAKAPKQPWESDFQFSERKHVKSEFAAFVGDRNGEPEFDFSKDTWSTTIRLDSRHFKGGKLVFSLPRIVRELIVSGVRISDFTGFPNSASQIKFIDCELESTANMNMPAVSDLKLTLDKCRIARSFRLADGMPGASLNKLVITKFGEYDAIDDFKFLGGSAKLREIKSIDVENIKTITSFEGIASAVEGGNILKIVINTMQFGAKVNIESFSGLPGKIEWLSIDNATVTKHAADGAKEHFPEISKHLQFSCKNSEPEILDPMFKTAWVKAQDGCDFYYNEKRGYAEFDTSAFEALHKDKSPSRFMGLPKKDFNTVRLDLNLSPRNKYECKAFQTCKIGFSSENVFDPGEIPLMQNADRIFSLLHGPSKMLDKWDYAVIDNGRIMCFDKNTLGFAERQYTALPSFKYICLDDATRLPGADAEQVLQCFFKTRKEDFPNTAALVLTERFKGEKISGIDAPDLSVRIQPRALKISLTEISGCKFKSLSDKRVYGRGAVKPEDTDLVLRNCAFTDNVNVYAKAVYDCAISSTKRNDNIDNMKIYVSDGIFNTSINEPYLSGVRIFATRLENCEIASCSTVCITGVGNMSKVKTEFRQLQLYLPENANIAKDCQFTATTDMSSMEIGRCSGAFSKDKCNELANAIASCISKSQIRALNLAQFSKIDTLKFLEQLQPGVEIQVVSMQVSSVADFSFKLRPGSKVCVIRSDDEQSRLKGIGKDVTLDGFDGSVGLSFNYFNMANDEKPIFQQFTKYFTLPVKGSKISAAGMKPDPNYVGKDGRFHAPKTLQEKFFGRPTTLEEAAWLRVMKLFD